MVDQNHLSSILRVLTRGLMQLLFLGDPSRSTGVAVLVGRPRSPVALRLGRPLSSLGGGCSTRILLGVLTAGLAASWADAALRGLALTAPAGPALCRVRWRAPGLSLEGELQASPLALLRGVSWRSWCNRDCFLLTGELIT